VRDAQPRRIFFRTRARRPLPANTRSPTGRTGRSGPASCSTAGRSASRGFRFAPAPDAPQRWDIESEAAIRLRFLGIDKRINLQSRDRVRADLTLERFEYAYDLDGSALDVRGESDGRNLALRVRASGASEERKIPLSAPLYPQSAITLVPVMRGMSPGRTLRFLVLQGETQQVALAEQKIVAWERSPLFDGSAFKVDTQLLGVDTTTWIGADGRPVFELALHGTMISALETEPQGEELPRRGDAEQDRDAARFQPAQSRSGRRCATRVAARDRILRRAERPRGAERRSAGLRARETRACAAASIAPSSTAARTRRC
jgi:hypothetical protein